MRFIAKHSHLIYTILLPMLLSLQFCSVMKTQDLKPMLLQDSRNDSLAFISASLYSLAIKSSIHPSNRLVEEYTASGLSKSLWSLVLKLIYEFHIKHNMLLSFLGGNQFTLLCFLKIYYVVPRTNPKMLYIISLGRALVSVVTAMKILGWASKAGWQGALL